MKIRRAILNQVKLFLRII